MLKINAANWVVGGIVALLVAGSLVYFDSPSAGRAFTRTQVSTQQEQGNGANHKRTRELNW
jgi:hypothetical protein